MSVVQVQEYDVAAIMGALYGDGITALKGAFTPEWADAMHEDIMTLFEKPGRPRGSLPRVQRWYVEVQPTHSRLRRHATHPCSSQCARRCLARYKTSRSA